MTQTATCALCLASITPGALQMTARASPEVAGMWTSGGFVGLGPKAARIAPPEPPDWFRDGTVCKAIRLVIALDAKRQAKDEGQMSS
jgi:hypothetical protein